MTAIQAERPTGPAKTDLVKADGDPFKLDITFTNSEGCREKPPGSLIQEWAPLMVEPSGVSTSRIRKTEAP